MVHRAATDVNVSIGHQRRDRLAVLAAARLVSDRVLSLPGAALEQCERKVLAGMVDRSGPDAEPVLRPGSESDEAEGRLAELWAASSSTTRRLARGLERAHSSSTPACATRSGAAGRARSCFPPADCRRRGRLRGRCRGAGCGFRRRGGAAGGDDCSSSGARARRIRSSCDGAASKRARAGASRLARDEARPDAARPRRGRRHRRPDRLSPERRRRLRDRDRQQLPRRDDRDPRVVRAGRASST